MRDGLMTKCCLVYLVVWCVSPPLSYGNIFRLLALAAIAYIFIQQTHSLDRMIIPMVFIIGYMIVLGVVVGDSITYRINTLIFLGMTLCAYKIFTLKDKESMYKRIMLITFSLCIVWNITTLRAIAETPNIMRLLVRNSDISISYTKSGVGGYGYVYAIILMLPIAIEFARERLNQMVHRVIAWVYIGSSYMLVFNSQYFMAIVLSLTIVPIYIIAKRRDAILKGFLLCAVLILVVVIYINADNLLLILADMVEGRSLQDKILSTYEILVNGNDIETSDFAERYERYTRDIGYIFNNPLLGVLRYGSIGKHSHFLDFLAQYGIPLGCIYLTCLFGPYRYIKMKNNPAVFTSFFVFVAISLFNTVTYSLSCIVYIIMPLHSFAMRGEGEE